MAPLIPMQSITLRSATLTDIHPASVVAAAAFHDTELFGTLMHPHRTAYSTTYLRFFTQMLEKKWLDHRRRIIVAVDRSGTEEAVVGIAEWERMGKGGEKMELGWWDPSM